MNILKNILSKMSQNPNSFCNAEKSFSLFNYWEEKVNYLLNFQILQFNFKTNFQHKELMNANKGKECNLLLIGDSLIEYMQSSTVKQIKLYLINK